MKSNYNIYMFINKNEEVIYVGKTKRIEQRLELQHFTKSGHCPTSCYLETVEIWYADVENESEMAIYEIYFINQHKPKYNKTYMYESSVKNELLPDLLWKKYKKEDLVSSTNSDNKQSEIAARARLRYGKDDDLIEAWNKLPKRLDKSDVVRHALRLYFFKNDIKKEHT